jgi:hypothetical protein
MPHRLMKHHLKCHRRTIKELGRHAAQATAPLHGATRTGVSVAWRPQLRLPELLAVALLAPSSRA